MTEEDVRHVILQALASQRLTIAAKRVFARARIYLSVSIEKKVLASASSRETLVAELRAAAEQEVQKATSAIGADQIELDLDKELQAIDAVIRSGEAAAALRLLPSKEILNTLAPRAGCKNGADLMRSLKRNFSPGDFTQLAELKAMIEQSAQMR